MSTLAVNVSVFVNCSSMAPSNVDSSIPMTHVAYLRLTIWGEAWIVWSWNVVQGCGMVSLGKTCHSKSDFQNSCCRGVGLYSTRLLHILGCACMAATQGR